MSSDAIRRVTPLHPPSAAELIRRAVRLRCPWCGRTALFAGWFRMHLRCAVCGFQYEREHGYFVGAIYLNYAVTAVSALAASFLLEWKLGSSARAQLAIVLPLAVLLPLVSFRHSRSLWLLLDLLFTRGERA